jgi:hypothetical protein
MPGTASTGLPKNSKQLESRRERIPVAFRGQRAIRITIFLEDRSSLELASGSFNLCEGFSLRLWLPAQIYSSQFPMSPEPVFLAFRRAGDAVSDPCTGVFSGYIFFHNFS